MSTSQSPQPQVVWRAESDHSGDVYDILSQRASFNDLKTRVNRDHAMAAYFEDCKEALNLDDIRSVLSIGPADGFVDIPLLRTCFTGVQTYYGCERDPLYATTLQDRLCQEWPSMKVDVSAKPVHDYEGPIEKVDATFLFHILHYFKGDALQEVVDKCVAWTKPGGLIFVTATFKDVFKSLSEDIYTWLHLKIEDILQSFEKAGLDIIRDDKIQDTYDLTHRTQEMIDFALFKKANEEEAQQVHDIMDQYPHTSVDLKFGMIIAKKPDAEKFTPTNIRER